MYRPAHGMKPAYVLICARLRERVTERVPRIQSPAIEHRGLPWPSKAMKEQRDLIVRIRKLGISHHHSTEKPTIHTVHQTSIVVVEWPCTDAVLFRHEDVSQALA